jgi:hypothetical protein
MSTTNFDQAGVPHAGFVQPFDHDDHHVGEAGSNRRSRRQRLLPGKPVKIVALAVLPLVSLPFLGIGGANAETSESAAEPTGDLTICITGADRHSRAQFWSSEENLETHQGIGGGATAYSKLRNGCSTLDRVEARTRLDYWTNPKAPYFISSVRTQQTAGTGASVKVFDHQREFAVVLKPGDHVTVTLHISKHR